MQMGSKGGEGSRTSSLPVSPLLINAINLDEVNRRQWLKKLKFPAQTDPGTVGIGYEITYRFIENYVILTDMVLMME